MSAEQPGVPGGLGLHDAQGFVPAGELHAFYAGRANLVGVGPGMGPFNTMAGHGNGAQLRLAGGPGPGDKSLGMEDKPPQRQNCTFFMRTGTCAYGERCKFLHPADCPPPQLNSRGYPMRAGEPDCAHYIKKGWCAFGLTCKFNHPELAQQQLLSPAAFAIGGMLGGVQAPTAASTQYLNLAGATTSAATAAALGMPSHGLYAMPAQSQGVQPSAVYYLPTQLTTIGGAGAAMAGFPGGALAAAGGPSAQAHQAAYGGSGLTFQAAQIPSRQQQMTAQQHLAQQHLALQGAAGLVAGMDGQPQQQMQGVAMGRHNADQLTRAVQGLRLSGNRDMRSNFR